MKHLLRLFQFKGFSARDVSISLKDNTVVIDLEAKPNKKFTCYHCRSPLGRLRVKHRMKIKELSIMGMRCWVRFWRRKGECPTCNKARSEHISFIAKETPHMSQRYAWWIGAMCEIAAESRVAELVGEAKMTVMRIDLARIKGCSSSIRFPTSSGLALMRFMQEVKARRRKTEIESSSP